MSRTGSSSWFCIKCVLAHFIVFSCFAVVGQSEQRGGRLVVSETSEPKHFNPVTAVDWATKTVVGLLMADLLHIDREDQKVYPNLASDWGVSEDGRTYTLTLRDGVRFSDGHPVDVDDVLFSLRVNLDEAINSPQRGLLIVGGEPIRARKLGARRIVFELAEPYAAGERLFDSFYILPRHRLEASYESGELASAWGLLSDPEQIVGLGPFRLEQVVPGERIVLERNPYYWKVDEAGEALPHLDEVVILLTSSEDAELLRFKAGEIHMIQDLGFRDFDALDAESSFGMRDLGPGLEHNFLFFNLNDRAGGEDEALDTRQSWFRNDAFRRAVSDAIDRHSMVRLVYGGRAAPLASHVTPGNKFWINRSLVVAPHSEALAKESFRDAGFRWNEAERLVDAEGRLVEFSILTSAGNRPRSMMASLIQEDLKRVGIEVTIATLEFRAYIDRIFQGRDFDTALLGLGGSDADPNPEMSFLLSDGGMHVWRLAGATTLPWQVEIDRLMHEQTATTDIVRRKELYGRVQQILFDYRPFISLVSPHILVGARAKLGNFRPGILPPYTLWNAEELFWTR